MKKYTVTVTKIGSIGQTTAKGICMNCGEEVENSLYADELGPHIICPKCGASFDVEVNTEVYRGILRYGA